MHKDIQGIFMQLREEIKRKILTEGLIRFSKDGYPLEFVEEDTLYFIGTRKNPNLRDFIEGLTKVRIYAKLRKRERKTNKTSLNRLEKKYRAKKYTRTIAYMWKVLTEKGYEVGERKRLIVFYFNFVRPDIMSNAGIFICLKKLRKNEPLRKKSLEELRKEIPKDWLMHIDAFLSLYPSKK